MTMHFLNRRSVESSYVASLSSGIILIRNMGYYAHFAQFKFEEVYKIQNAIIEIHLAK
jgi:2,3-bisphosphoglycerate-independent phosphoglycerate mutase